jgi:flagellar hook protein FlgE
VGTIRSNSLEQSNVDIAKQFTDMITTQRAYQANSRVISTTKDMLQEVINLTR